LFLNVKYDPYNANKTTEVGRAWEGGGGGGGGAR
jgi:hypothetical protein